MRPGALIIWCLTGGRTDGGRAGGRADGRTGKRTDGRESKRTGGRTDGRAGGRADAGFHTEGGRGGFIPLMILARGDIPPIKLQNSVFFNGHFSEVLQESVQKTNPLF